jgi:hypothetical protein
MKRGKMIKFRGKELIAQELIEGDLVHNGYDVQGFCSLTSIKKEDMYPVGVTPHSVEINISGHWLKVEDLEAIVEKVMGGKGE